MSSKLSPKPISFGEPLEPFLRSFSCQNLKNPTCFHTFCGHAMSHDFASIFVKIVRLLYVFIHSVDMPTYAILCLKLELIMSKSSETYMFSYIPLTSVVVRSGDKIGRYLCPHCNVPCQNHENPLCFHTFCGHASADVFDANFAILSKRARAGAKTAPSGPRKSPRWLQDAFRLPKIACKRLTDSLKCFQQGQAWPQELPKCP